MKRSLVAILFLWLINGCGLFDTENERVLKDENNQHKKMTEQVFEDIQPSVTGTKKLQGFEVTLKMEAEQPVSRGLHFSVELKNGNKEEVRLYQPLYFLQLNLRDGSGNPFSLLKKPPVPLIHSGQPVQADEDFVFTIREIRMNETVLDVDKAINEPSVHFTSGTTISYQLELKRILDPHSGKDMPMPAGDYLFGLMLSIVDADFSAVESEDSSRTMQTPEIKIKLTEAMSTN